MNRILKKTFITKRRNHAFGGKQILVLRFMVMFILCLSSVVFAQDADIDNTVRIIYFVPQQTIPLPNIQTKLDKLIKDVQQFYADEMQRHGFGRKTFALETNPRGRVILHRVNGQFSQAYYQHQTEQRISAEITPRFDFANNVYLVVLEIGQKKVDGGSCGVAGDNWNNRTRSVGGRALVSTFADCLSADEGPELIAHELGHAFGLFHDFRDDTYLMSYGNHRTKLSRCAGEWLNAHRYFNHRGTPGSNMETTFTMQPVEEVPPNGIRLRFEATDPDGLRYAQLLTTSTGLAPGSPMLIGCQALKGQNTTATFVIKELPPLVNRYPVTFRIVDRLGNYAWESYEIQTPGLAAGPKIEGPWLWMLTSTGGLGGASAATAAVDFLAVASDGNVKEQDIATTGAIEGDRVGDRVWTRQRLAPTGSDNITDLMNNIGWVAGDIDNAVAYGSVILSAPRRQETTMFVGSDDAVKIWLNGKLVHNNPINRGAADYQDAFPVTLKKGENVLLVAVYEFWGGWSGFFGFLSDAKYTVMPPDAEEQRPQANDNVVDVNKDGVVNVLDLVLVANALGKNAPDLNDDGIVNILDLVLVAAAF